MNEITFLHWILAVLGLLIHLLTEIGKYEGDIKAMLKDKKIITTSIASALFIPVIFLICSEQPMKEYIPINYLTAFIAGFQTQDVMGLFGDLVNRKIQKIE